MKELRLSEPLIRQLRAHAAAAAPAECCGLIAGAAVANGWRADFLVPSTNLADDPLHAFEIDPAVRLGLQRALREEGLNRKIIGCYHSHPSGPPGLSATDQARAEEAGLVWLILAGGAAWDVHAAVALGGGRGFETVAWVADTPAREPSRPGGGSG
jgi:proteasome lid subunit RPN8/RPN11